jgi:hypothetical protein
MEMSYVIGIALGSILPTYPSKGLGAAIPSPSLEESKVGIRDPTTLFRVDHRRSACADIYKV